MNKIQAGESLRPLRVYFFFAPQARSGWCEERGCHSTETPSTREIFTSSSTSSSLRTTGSAPRNLWYVGHVVYLALQPVGPPHGESDSFPPHAGAGGHVALTIRTTHHHRGHGRGRPAGFRREPELIK